MPSSATRLVLKDIELMLKHSVTDSTKVHRRDTQDAFSIGITPTYHEHNIVT